MATKKNQVSYVCESCGARSAKWSGRCANCGEWNTLIEHLSPNVAGLGAQKGKLLKASQLSNITVQDSKGRLKVGLSDVDNVLGGGLVPGSVTLLAGEPGIGKSTLLLQVADQLAKRHNTLYVSAEESAGQIKLRASRLKAGSDKLNVVSTTNSDDIATTIAGGTYGVVVVDSIQTVSTALIGSSTGSISQITGSAQLLIRAAKASGAALILVGHVTKQGTIAGPKLLEHLVDVVLNLEGDRYGGFKILRSVKNRYGSTNESGVFEMTDRGLSQIDNPSAALLAERQVSDGSVVMAAMEGSRALLVEIQALVIRSAFGYPKRTASGVDINRLNLLIAMLSRRTKLNLQDHDVYINVVGGLSITEPAADLAVCMAIASAAKGMQLKDDAVVFGEVGLSGEVRHVPSVDKRIAEAKKLGFKAAIGPRLKQKNPFVHSIASVRDALNTYLVKG